MRSSGIFITGTNTGVGKTVVTAALALALRHLGLRVGVMKPAETGCPREDGRLQPQDALLLRQVSGCEAPLEVINPYALTEPLAPALAAALDGVQIELEHMCSCYRQLEGEHDVVLVEGAGGLLVPLTSSATMLDLAANLSLPLLIVAGNVLGVINHAALTVAAAHQRGLGVLGVVLNDAAPGADIATRTNGSSLRRWAGADLLAELPYLPDLGGEGLRALGARLPVDAILTSMRS